jgi:hypothetical protein
MVGGVTVLNRKTTNMLSRSEKRSGKEFAISANYIDEVEVDVVPLDVCSIVFGGSYMYMRDAIFMRRANQYRLNKDGKFFIINAHKCKSKISLVSAI